MRKETNGTQANGIRTAQPPPEDTLLTYIFANVW